MPLAGDAANVAQSVPDGAGASSGLATEDADIYVDPRFGQFDPRRGIGAPARPSHRPPAPPPTDVTG